MRLSWLYGLKIRFAAGVGLLLMLVGAPFFYLFYTLHRARSIDSLKRATTDLSRVLVATIERPMFERQPHTLTDAATRSERPTLRWLISRAGFRSRVCRRNRGRSKSGTNASGPISCRRPFKSPPPRGKTPRSTSLFETKRTVLRASRGSLP